MADGIFSVLSRRVKALFSGGSAADADGHPGYDLTDLEYMGEVSAALLYRGSKWAYWLSSALVALFVIFLLWSLFTDRNEVTRGDGQITPSHGVQPIQSEQGGVIKKIFVKEGQEVKAGDMLAQMSNIEALAEHQNLLNKQVEYTLALRRLEAERSNTTLEYTAEDRLTYPLMVDDQLRLFATRKEKLESGTREIQANLEQKRLAVKESLSKRHQYERNLLLLKERVERVRELVRAKKYSEIEFLTLRQQVITQEGELNALAESIARLQSEVQEEERRLANRDTEWQAQIASEQNENRRQLDSVNKKLEAGSHFKDLADLKAPMNGVIRRILLKEETVAQRAQTVMELLPTDDSLEVDARFSPPVRAYLNVGDEAQVKVDAYDFTIYGALPAKVIRISPDTIEDSKGQAWYVVRLITASSKLVNGTEELEIKPGMTVKAEVISGKKSVFDYLMKPMMKTRQKKLTKGSEVSPSADTQSGSKSPDAGTSQEAR